MQPFVERRESALAMLHPRHVDGLSGRACLRRHVDAVGCHDERVGPSEESQIRVRRVALWPAENAQATIARRLDLAPDGGRRIAWGSSGRRDEEGACSKQYVVSSE